MSPRKQPSSLFEICIKRSLCLINNSCYNIEKCFPNTEFSECEKKVFDLRRFLMVTLPARLFDVLCLKRGTFPYRGDPRILLNVLLHSRMTVFRKNDTDNNISQYFWIRLAPLFSHLVVLDLKFICTDEILEAIATKCLLLEELNIVSKVNIRKSFFNASVLIRNVSDAGLCFIANLKQLRILSMDPPRNERASRVGRCVSQAGIIMLLGELPYLEELRIESCDVGSTLIGSDVDIGPLSLKKINCHFTSVKGIEKLIKICPHLRELSITHLSSHDKDAVMEQIASSELRLHRLAMSFFSYSSSMQHLLHNQGRYLTHFSLWETDHTMTIEALMKIGLSCPSLTSLCLSTQSKNFVIPRFFRRPDGIFSRLESLTIGTENFNIEDILVFFLECTQNLEKLAVKYQSKITIDQMLTNVLVKGYLKSIKWLWLDCTLEVSKNVVIRIIESCENLSMFTVDCTDYMSEIQMLISENNLDLNMGGY